MGSLQGPVEFFLRYGLSKRAVASSTSPYGAWAKSGPLGLDYLLLEPEWKDLRADERMINDKTYQSFKC
jgi:hypothetical protein